MKTQEETDTDRTKFANEKYVQYNEVPYLRSIPYLFFLLYNLIECIQYIINIY